VAILKLVHQGGVSLKPKLLDVSESNSLLVSSRLQHFHFNLPGGTSTLSLQPTTWSEGLQHFHQLLSLQHSHQLLSLIKKKLSQLTLTSTLSMQHSHFNTLSATSTLTLTSTRTLTSTLSLQYFHFNTLTSTLSTTIFRQINPSEINKI